MVDAIYYESTYFWVTTLCCPVERGIAMITGRVFVLYTFNDKAANTCLTKLRCRMEWGTSYEQNSFSNVCCETFRWSLIKQRKSPRPFCRRWTKKTTQLPLQKYHFKKWILPLKSFGFFVTALSTISLQIFNWPFRAASVNRDCETLLQRGVSLSMKSLHIEHTVRHLINSFLLSLLKISTAMWGMNSSFTTNGNTSIFEVSFEFMLSSESVLMILYYAIPVCKTMQKK